MKPEKHREIIAMKQVRILFYILLNFLLRYKLVELFTHLQQIKNDKIRSLFLVNKTMTQFVHYFYRSFSSLLLSGTKNINLTY